MKRVTRAQLLEKVADLVARDSGYDRRTDALVKIGMGDFKNGVSWCRWCHIPADDCDKAEGVCPCPGAIARKALR